MHGWQEKFSASCRVYNWMSAWRPQHLEQLEENLRESTLMHLLLGPKTLVKGLNPKLGVLLVKLGGRSRGRTCRAIRRQERAVSFKKGPSYHVLCYPAVVILYYTFQMKWLNWDGAKGLIKLGWFWFEKEQYNSKFRKLLIAIFQ